MNASTIARRLLQLHVTPAELVGGFGAELRRELRGAQGFVKRRGFREVALLVERFRFQQLRLVGALRRRI